MATTYEIQLRYSLDDKASQALEGLSQRAQRTEQAVSGVGEMFKKVAAVFSLEKGFELGKHYFIELNSEMEQMKLKMTSISSYNLAKPFAEMAPKVNDLVEGWQQFSKQTTLTTSQLTEFGTAISTGVYGAGGKLSELDEITKRGAVVGQILASGHPGGLRYAALEFNEALMGNFRKNQMMNMQLLKPTLERAGIDIEQWNQLTARQRMNLIRQALMDPSWNAAIDKMKSSWEGVTSTFRDNLEIIGRQIGSNLFDALKGQFAELNHWLDGHQEQIQGFAREFSETLIGWFQTVKDIFSFVIANKDALMALAKVWALSKVTGMALGGAGKGGSAKGWAELGSSESASLSGFLSNRMGAFGGTVAGMAGGAARGYFLSEMMGTKGEGVWSDLSTGAQVAANAFSTLPGPIGQVAAGLSVLQLGLQAAADAVLDSQKEQIARETETARVMAQYKQYENANHVMTEQNARALMTILGEAGAQHGFRIDEHRVNELAAARGLDQAGYLALAQAARAAEKRMMEIEFGPKFDPKQAEREKPEKRQINVNINRIEVASDDPDRFVQVLATKAAQAIRSPGAAKDALSTHIY